MKPSAGQRQVDTIFLEELLAGGRRSQNPGSAGILDVNIHADLCRGSLRCLVGRDFSPSFAFPSWGSITDELRRSERRFHG